MSEAMNIQEVVELTGISKQTLYNLMDSGQADLGVVVRAPERNTYFFFRSKVERFVKGGESAIFPESMSCLSRWISITVSC